VDAFAHEGALDDLRRVRVLAVKDVVAGVEDGHLGAQAPEALRQLAADGAGPDDGEARRPLRQVEHTLVGEKARLAETGHAGLVGAGAGREDGPPAREAPR